MRPFVPGICGVECGSREKSGPKFDVFRPKVGERPPKQGVAAIKISPRRWVGIERSKVRITVGYYQVLKRTTHCIMHLPDHRICIIMDRLQRWRRVSMRRRQNVIYLHRVSEKNIHSYIGYKLRNSCLILMIFFWHQNFSHNLTSHDGLVVHFT